MPFCRNCGVPLAGLRRVWCSTKCKNTASNAKYQNYAAQQCRALSRRVALVNLFGGKCSRCGYDINLAALVFHHRSTDKHFRVDSRNCSNRTWESLLKETQKCELLCANCHAEEHHPTLRLSLLL